MNKIFIIGGCNYDMTAFSYNPLIEKDSNIGKLSTAPGGVSRNIAVDLSYLGDKVSFLTAIGTDVHGDMIRRELTDLNIDVFNIKSNLPTSTYLAIHDSDGDLKVAICASDIYDQMKVEQIEPYINVLRNQKKIVIDTNLNQQIIDYLFMRLPNTEFYVEGVSANKITRIKEHLDKIQLLKCNIIEARHLLNKEVNAEVLVNTLLSKGVKKIVISQGSDPIYIGEKDFIEPISVPKVNKIINTSGSGDGLFSGIIHELHQGKSLKEAVLFGIKVSQVILQSPISTSKDLAKLVSK